MNDKDMMIQLMQNVSDKLDDISQSSNKKDLLNKFQSIGDSLNQNINNAQHLLNKKIDQSNNNVIGVFRSSTGAILEKPPVTNNIEKNHYVFGKDTPFTSKFLLITLSVIIVLSSIIKHVPGYLTQHSTLKSERDSYKLFYDYIYLNAFVDENKSANNVKKVLIDISNEKPELIHKIEELRKVYAKEIRRESLLQELNKLEKSK